MRQINFRSLLPGVLLLTMALASCAPPPAGNSNNSTNNVNTNSNSANANTSSKTDAGIDTREPDVYRAKLTFKAETIGEQASTLPTITVEYSRNLADRRISFNVPGAGPIVYLDVKDKRIVILPDRKQYAEITPDATGGVQIPSSMTPGEIVARLKTAKGYELIGDDTFNGRPVTKYKFAGSKSTNTAVGTVSAESFVYVDKATGLPLRSETVSEGSNDVKGVKGIKLITEMSDLQTTVDPATFEVPAGLKKISADEVKQQVEATVKLALAVLGQMRMQNSAPAASTSPTASPSSSPVK